MTSQGVRIKIDTESHIRPLNPGRDMPAVLDLIELGFQKELDPQGWKMLKQMRRLYQPGHPAQALYGAGSDTAGFVWIESDRIVGNLSLRHAQPSRTQGRLIGNVVVHPDHRGRGIGRALMERALEAARSNHARWVGLEVRADNAVACTLYRHLGFRVVGITRHFVRPKALPWPRYPAPDRKWRRAGKRDSARWKQLATLIHPYDQRLVLEVRAGVYEFGGLEKWLNLWLSRRQEKAWIYPTDAGNVAMATHLETEMRYHFHSWEVLMHPELGEEGVRELIARCVADTRRYPPWPTITIVPDQPPLIDGLTEIGFRLHRTLQQMILDLA